jgi:nicotinamide-nucleotide amidase
MNKTLLSLSRQCGELLLQHHCKVTTAESCTGGWIAQCITAVAGSSEWFETGFVTYSNQAKQQLLSVPVSHFEGPRAPGAVSEETVLAMARGALLAAGAQYAVSTSGVAGPDGGTPSTPSTPGKPVGMVWIGWAWRKGDAVESLATVQRFTGDREAVRKQSVQAALEGLLALLQARNVPAAEH